MWQIEEFHTTDAEDCLFANYRTVEGQRQIDKHIEEHGRFSRERLRLRTIDLQHLLAGEMLVWGNGEYSWCLIVLDRVDDK